MLTDAQTLISTSSWYQGRQQIFQQRKHVYFWPAERALHLWFGQGHSYPTLAHLQSGPGTSGWPPGTSAAWWVDSGEKPWLFFHSVEYPGHRLFHSGLWIIGSTIQALESHARQLPEPWSFSLSLLIYVHLLSGVNELALAWPLDIVSSLNVKSFTFIIKWGVGRGLRSTAGCVWVHRSQTWSWSQHGSQTARWWHAQKSLCWEQIRSF